MLNLFQHPIIRVATVLNLFAYRPPVPWGAETSNRHDGGGGDYRIKKTVMLNSFQHPIIKIATVLSRFARWSPVLWGAETSSA
jgi:hypothetical protein